MPLLVAQLLERDAGGVAASIVEQHVEAAEGLLELREERRHLLWLADVSRHHQGVLAGCARQRHGLFQEGLATTRERDAIAVGQECQRRRSTDTRAGASHDGDFVL